MKASNQSKSVDVKLRSSSITPIILLKFIAVKVRSGEMDIKSL